MAAHQTRPRLDKDSPLSIREQWARQHSIYAIQDEWNKLLRLAKPADGIDYAPDFLKGDTLPAAPLRIPKQHSKPDDAEGGSLEVNVGIIGAGAAGLFTAMTLEYLNGAQTGVKFTYDILEADSQRSGGRLFTYQFSTDPHDDYDVGAMRFPDHPVMTRTFDLFKKLGMNVEPLGPSGPSGDPPLGSLVPYYMTNIDPVSNQAQEPWRYNDVNQWGSYSSIVKISGTDPWQLDADRSLEIDPELLASGLDPGTIFQRLIEPIRQALKDDIQNHTNTGWDMLMSFDSMTTTQFLSTPYPPPSSKWPQPDVAKLPPYNYDTIQWFETFNGGTDWYDQAFSEIVLESLDFEYKTAEDPGPAINWYCVLGGAQQLATRMETSISSKVQYSSLATRIAVQAPMSVDVTINGGPDPAKPGGTTKTYSCVFNTTTLGCLEHMDTTAAGLNSATRTATRALGYGPSCKVAIRFTHAWWIHDLPADTCVKRGGLGHSDLNMRTCVYPSYNINDPPGTPAVLLVSYTWQQDAQRLGSLFTGDPSTETALRDLLIADLVKLHSSNRPGDPTPEQLYDIIQPAYMTHFAWDWYTNPNTAGAFAFFRPFQFSSMWGKMIQPSGDVVVVGEHASPHHAWVVGALESVVHGLAAWCHVNAGKQPALKDVINVLVGDEEGNPFWNGLLGVWDRQELLEGRRREREGEEHAEKKHSAKKRRAHEFLSELGVMKEVAVR
ncbi:putative amine oxidase [Rhypophila decipiens]